MSEIAQDTAIQLLLACLANPEGDFADQLSDLSAKESERLLALAQASRCTPLLHHIIAKSGVELPVSPQLAHTARDQALTSLAQARGLVRAVQILRQAGMEPIALKGVALAWRDYPAPQMRVLRDVDLLLSIDQVVQAHQLLLSCEGYRPAPWAGQYGAEYGHQMPEILDETHGMVIELHHRLNARGWSGDEQLTRMARTQVDEIELLGERIRVPTTPVNLLHLVEHATYHHMFANGPAIMADFHFLCRMNTIDWESVIAEARELDLARSLALLATVCGHYGATWVPQSLLSGEQLPDAAVARAVQAMFADQDTHLQNDQMWRLARSSGGKIGPASALSRIFSPNRHQLARLSGRAPDSLWRWLGYPKWLMEKGGRFLSASSAATDAGGFASYAALRDWIETGKRLGE